MSENAQQRNPDRDVDAGDPDVLLDIPKVSVDSIRLVVDGLDADISLRARLANLLQLDAGVRVHLQGVELDIDGVHAEAQLRVRLEQLVTLLGRALDTIDNNPQIIESLARAGSGALDDVNRGTQQLAAGAAEVTALAQHSGVRDELARQAGVPGELGDQTRTRPARPAGSRPTEGQRPESRLEGRWPVDRASAQAHPTSAGQGSEGQRPPEGQDRQQPGGDRSAATASATGKPADQPGGSPTPGPGESRASRGGSQGGQDGSGGMPSGQGAGGQAAGGQGGGGQAGGGQSGGGGGQGGGGQGGGGVSSGAHAAAQSAAQLAEQAGETLRQAGRSVWEAIQGGMAQHRQQGRRDQ
ncbi:hypothetical protein [Micromonospora sp. NBC_00617]|uniref:hypothetical protein n=1 Tax=Micromonospora sp. NBC_00617 TaxID=2903587 RepID=UPI0030E2F955